MSKTLQAWRATAGRAGRLALHTVEITDRLVRQAKQPGFPVSAWDELTALIAVGEYRRIAANRETRDWREDVRLLHQFSQIAAFGHEIRRMAETGNTVFMDVIETLEMKADRFSVNTLAVLEFDDAGKMHRHTTYQQWDPQRVPTHVGRGS